MAKKAKNNGHGQPATIVQQLGSLLGGAHDNMRKEKGGLTAIWTVCRRWRVMCER
ncbi:MAG TPA: hypothetical protein PKG54_16470 [Phycisphaerae bacterium]|jgi:hypothetical protein|nr:hypothetical protein [Phycisphaerae bacterium]HOB76110.1 hypothetical protein [Phycisphaerae bacterium]HOJ56033.1 hypothetical protein [Phycisphaerae bacterium]HOL27098.1 hypothetical protein [Phycisphaerae bacterium]HPP21230.1 hypothetical protein [Phycisphaerae bacterium]